MSTTIEKKMNAEAGKFEALYSQLHPSHENENLKNWDRINHQFTERLQNTAQIDADFIKLTQSEQQKVSQAYQAFSKEVTIHKLNILERMAKTGSILIAKKPNTSSLPARIFRSLYNHKEAIALGASFLIAANQTTIGSQLITGASQMISKHSNDLLNPLKKIALEGVKLASNHLPAIGSILSAAWALPAAYRAGFSKKGVAILALGTATAIAPHVLKPGISLQTAWENVKNLGTTAIAACSKMFHQEL